MSTHRLTLTVITLTFLALIALTQGAAAKAVHGSDCRDLMQLDAGDSWRSTGADAGEARCFELGVPSSGVLALDVLTPPGSAAPRLTAVDASCREVAPAHFADVLAEGAARLVLLTTDGPRRFCVRAQDPRRRLAAFRVVSAFADLDDSSSPGAETVINSGGEGEEDPREIEIHPEDVAPVTLVNYGGGSGEGGEDPREIEIHPESLRSLLCHHLGDDHADVALCATPLVAGRTLEGELANDHDDDVDVFELHVAAARTFEIGIRGAASVGVALHDERGERLAFTRDSAKDGGRLFKTLLPGRYTMHVSGSGNSVTPYHVRVTELAETR